MKKLIILMVLLCSEIYSQEYFPTNTGVKNIKSTQIAFTNAKIYITPSKVLNKGTLLIKNGKIIGVGKQVTIPKGTKTINLNGKYIYPSFVESYSNFGINPSKSASWSNRPQYDATRKGYYWNDHLRPETNSKDLFKFNTSKAKSFIHAGFGIISTHNEDGIMQGNGMLVALDVNSNNAYRILDTKAGNYLSFNRSKKSRQQYPTSLMGSMALIRQAYLDADWYAKGNTKNTDLTLEAINENKQLVQFFNAGSYKNALRADKVGDEFGIQYVILGGGDEYKRIKDIKNTKAPFIIPINFRKAYDVSNPDLAKIIPLSDMRAWNQEPTNPAILANNKITFAITTHQLKSPKSLKKNILKAIKYGLDKKAALKSLTTIPAKLLNNDKIGNLKLGSYANFLITSGDIFEPKTILFENWVLGHKNVINEIDIQDITGEYKIALNNKKYQLIISGKGSKQKGSIKLNNKKLKSKFSLQNDWIQLTLNDNNNFTRLRGQYNKDTGSLKGLAFDEEENITKWVGIKQHKKKAKKKTTKKKKEKKPHEVVPVSYPNLGFGNYTLPKTQKILIQNATLWTSEDKEPVLKNTDILIKNGKIEKIGKDISSWGAKIIDGTGKYVTAGIIDEHSHIATDAINEFGHNSSAEVSIEDVINPDDINIYRNIAGGVTTIQVLHGSANPIGGRSAIIKLKWGANVDELIYDNSPKFIKFALGENVKDSRNQYSYRFPQTRMGVEQVYMDYFQRAKEYDAKKKSGKPYRKDIELETLAEIINKQRFISCHSYIQSEINMLMKVAEKFNFTINTFTHILEGYKVADKMKKHGVGASTFSDWWAYKYEVNDAIPYNAAILHNQGIITAINSDDAEMSRRLNQEAAKTMKYGGVSEQDAWKMVTINPAKLLHLDHRTGSLKVGKDADIVVWSDNPLSIYSKAETTIIDGAIYFDITKDLEKRKAIKKERAKLIKMLLKEKIGGAPTQSPKKTKHKLFHCDTE